MRVDIYASTLNGRKYLLVPAGTKVTNGFPLNTTDTDYSKLRLFKRNMELRESPPLIGVDEVIILQSIADILTKQQSLVVLPRVACCAAAESEGLVVELNQSLT